MQLLLHEEPIGHLNVQLPPAQVLVQVAPAAHSTVQPPPAHDVSHVPPVPQTTTQPPRGHDDSHVVAIGHVQEMLVLLAAHLLSPGLPLDPPSLEPLSATPPSTGSGPPSSQSYQHADAAAPAARATTSATSDRGAGLDEAMAEPSLPLFPTGWDRLHFSTQPAPEHVFEQLAPGAHWNVHPPPEQVLLQTEPAAHWNVHPPPEQLFAQVEPASQRVVQRAPEHDVSHDALSRHVVSQPPAGQVVAQRPARHSQS